MLETMGQLSALIRAEVDAGIPAHRIVLGGFSQGGAVALLTGLTSEYKLGGVIVLSGWLPLHQKFAAVSGARLLSRFWADWVQMAGPHAKTVPIFWGHGEKDPLVKFAFGRASAERLTTVVGCSELSFRSYPELEHSASEQELSDIRGWLVDHV
jgi:lysophospholipase-1